VKARAWLPALLALAALLVLFLLMRGRSGGQRERPAPPVATGASTRPAPPASAALLPAAPDAGPTSKLGHKVDREPELWNQPRPTPKPKLALQEKLVLAAKHVEVMATRAGLLEQEIAALERDGKQQAAAEQRIVLMRLRQHMESLRQAIAEGREPE